MHDIFDQLIKLALREDLEPFGDLTSNPLFDSENNCKLLVKSRKEAGIMSGSIFSKRVFEILDHTVEIEFLKKDGESFQQNETLATLKGNTRSILNGERLFLNLLQRAISIASYTKQFVDQTTGTSAKILDTRKTTPGLRLLEKAAVCDGGGSNHRFNLSTGILIKDNHIAVAGGVSQAIQTLRKQCSHLMKIEIEVDTLEQLKEALNEKVEVVLLDNFSLDKLKEAVKLTNKKCLLEASGGVNLNTVKNIADTGVDYISVGTITQSPPQIDIGLDYC